MAQRELELEVDTEGQEVDLVVVEDQGGKDVVVQLEMDLLEVEMGEDMELQVGGDPVVAEDQVDRDVVDPG